MREGLLWFDDSGDALAGKVGRATTRYRQKFGQAPNACYVHPSALGESGSAAVAGVRILPLGTVLRNHFWLGREETR